MLTDSDEMSDEDDLDMSDFMREGGLEEHKKEEEQKKKEEEMMKKKQEEQEKRGADATEAKGDEEEGKEDEEEEKKDVANDTEPDDRMDGFMAVKKTKLDKKASLVPLGALNLNVVPGFGLNN